MKYFYRIHEWGGAFMEMKINSVNRPQKSDSVTRADQKDQESFKFTLLSKIDEASLQDKLKVMIGDITDQGQKLAKHMDVKDLKKI